MIISIFFQWVLTFGLYNALELLDLFGKDECETILLDLILRINNISVA